MTTEPTNPEATGPLELLESARVKYTLAQARVRRGPPELALLSLHGSLEDALRAHALRRQDQAAYEPFPRMIDALVGDASAPLSPQEAEGIQRMHRLRGRIARGEQINVTLETIDAYQRLVARLLPRYGVLVVGPEEPPAGAIVAGASARSTGRTRSLPPRERTAYPDDREAHPTLSSRSAADRARRSPDDDPRSERRPDGLTSSRRYLEETAQRVEAFSRVQGWLVPLLIIFSIFMIGATISIGWQQLGAGRQPTALPEPTLNPAITTIAPAVDPGTTGLPSEAQPTPIGALPTPMPAPTEPPPDVIAVGRTVYVQPDILPINVRAAPNIQAEVLVSLAPDTAMEVIDGPTQADGFTWWRVRSGSTEGWAAGEFLVVR